MPLLVWGHWVSDPRLWPKAEHADGELCRQLNALLSDGFHFDSALHEVVVVRHSLQMWFATQTQGG